MVSGLVTSPCDQLRIFSGDARLMRMASKSATGFAISNGLERNMFLRFPVGVTRPLAALNFSSQFQVLSLSENLVLSSATGGNESTSPQWLIIKSLWSGPRFQLSNTENWEAR